MSTAPSHPMFIVDAFSQKPGEGNPAAVVPLENWPADEVMQEAARVIGLSETAFLIPAVDETVDFRLRWFTPAVEMDLCGHATLGAAHAIRELARERGEAPPERVVFTSRGGRLTVAADQSTGRLALDFPARPPAPVDDDALLDRVAGALGDRPESLHKARDLVAVFPSREHVASLRPNFDMVTALGVHGVIATAPGGPDEADGAAVVSRFFAPEVGVDEDPVTGSAHCTIVPFWAERLGTTEFVCRQISRRGGTLWCRHRADEERVDLAGHTRTDTRGEIDLSNPVPVEAAR